MNEEKISRRTKEAILREFGRLPKLRGAKTEKILDSLKTRLLKYKHDLENLLAGDISFSDDPDFRDAVYKIEILSRIIRLKKGDTLDLVEMVKETMKENREPFRPVEYYYACTVVAYLIGTPFTNVPGLRDHLTELSPRLPRKK